MTLSIMTLCHYADRRCPECHILIIIMLCVIMLNVIMLAPFKFSILGHAPSLTQTLDKEQTH